MANMSTLLEEALLNLVFHEESYTPPTSYYVALFDFSTNEEDLEAGAVTGSLASAEVTEYDGNRKPLGLSSPTQVEGKATMMNESTIEFEEMPAVTVAYAAIVDEEDPANGGEILYWLELPEGSVEIAEGNIARIPAGDLVVDLD